MFKMFKVEKKKYNILPPILFILSFFLTIVPYKTYVFQYFLPFLDLIFIFYWSVYYSNLLSVSLVIAISLAMDLMSGGLLGLNLLSNILSCLFVIKMSDVFKELAFRGLWKAFSLYIIFSSFLKWLLFSLVYSNFVNIDILLVKIAVSIFVYPLFSFLFEKEKNNIGIFENRVI